MQAIILAGGEGKRLKELTKNLPKPLINLAGKPILDYIIESAVAQGIEDIIVCTGYLADKISGHIKKWSGITESRETAPLGTAGPLFLLKEKLADEFFVFYGDVYSEVNFQKMLEFHRRKNADATLLVHHSDHPQDSSVVSVDGNSRITQFIEKPGMKWKKYGNLTSAAMYILKRGALDFIKSKGITDFAKDVFPEMVKNGCRVYAYESEEYLKDIGTIERLKEVEEHIKSKRIAAFIDRDGTINDEMGLLTKKEQLKLIEGAAEGIKILNERGILAIILTNQPVVARNLITEDELKVINRRLIEMLEEKGAKIDVLYYCPHHPEKNHPEANNPGYRIECECRKPKTGMLEQAAKTFNIDVKNSYVAGDRTVDIKLGENAGCTTILLSSGLAGKDGKYDVEPDYTCQNLLEACKLIAKLSGVKK